jgi:hypothetical protein
LYEVLLVVRIDERVHRWVPAAVHLHQLAVPAQADHSPQADRGVRAEHLARRFDIGEERIAANSEEELARAGPDRFCAVVEADRRSADEHVPNGFGPASLSAGGIAGGRGLRAVVEGGEDERERDVGARIAGGVLR